VLYFHISFFISVIFYWKKNWISSFDREGKKKIISKANWGSKKLQYFDYKQFFFFHKINVWMFLQTFKHLFWREKRKSERLELTIFLKSIYHLFQSHVVTFHFQEINLKLFICYYFALLCFGFQKYFYFKKKK